MDGNRGLTQPIAKNVVAATNAQDLESMRLQQLDGLLAVH